MLPIDQAHYARHIFTSENYQHFVQQLCSDVGMKIEYRIAEMPIFVSNEFRQQMEQAAIEIALECMGNHHLQHSDASLPPQYTVPNQSAHPLFCIVDFAVTGSQEQGFSPKVVELQGFPSLFGYQLQYLRTVKRCFDFGRNYDGLLSSLSEEEYIEILRSAILAGYHPDEVALLEYKPEQQKTRPDFLIMKQLLGIGETDICSVRKEGNTLLHQRNGKWVEIRRIFNRAIADELDENKVVIPFQWTDQLNVEWAGHPNWYFRISKHSMPYLKHKAVPKTYFLNDLQSIPDNLEPFVLKPLFSFAGKGVNIFPTHQDIASISPEEKHGYVLQEKIQYAESIFTPEGMNKAELRIMMIWPEHAAQPIPVISLARTGRGPMMGVRYNSISWTGSSGCLYANPG
jgi:hypothetical protein